MAIQWRKCPETNGRYEASSTGLIRGVPTLIRIRRAGSVYTRLTSDKILKPHRMRRKAGAPEYEFVWLRVGGRSKRRAVHSLVLDAFVGPRKPNEQCRHWDGDSLNNSIENLLWGTPAENRADMRRHGREAVGERNGNTSLTREDALAIRVMHERGMSTRQLAPWFGVSPTTVGHIAAGRRWPSLVAALEAAP